MEFGAPNDVVGQQGAVVLQDQGVARFVLGRAQRLVSSRQTGQAGGRTGRAGPGRSHVCRGEDMERTYHVKHRETLAFVGSEYISINAVILYNICNYITS